MSGIEASDAAFAYANTSADAGSDAARACDTLLGDICWYLGTSGQSCLEVCEDRGGFDPAAIGVVGTASQGGSLEQCSDVLEALLGDAGDGVDSGTQEESGVGCLLYGEEGEQVRWWLSDPDFDPEASLPSTQLACGCNQ